MQGSKNGGMAGVEEYRATEMAESTVPGWWMEKIGRWGERKQRWGEQGQEKRDY